MLYRIRINAKPGLILARFLRGLARAKALLAHAVLDRIILRSAAGQFGEKAGNYRSSRAMRRSAIRAAFVKKIDVFLIGFAAGHWVRE